MKIFALAMPLFLYAAGALAQQTAAPEHQVSATGTIVSDYIFRGMTQTWHRPAVQASIDYAHASGMFASVWASTVSDKVIAGAHAEIDLIFGYKRAMGEDWNVGGGVLSVFYPGGNWNRMRWGDRPDKKYDFSEANAFIGYKVVTLKYSVTLNDLFGFSKATGFSGSTKHSRYLELNADIPLANSGFVLGLHAGRSDIKATAGGIDPDATDYRISLARDFGSGWNGSLNLTRNANTAFLDGTRSNLDERDMRDIGKARLWLGVTKVF